MFFSNMYINADVVAAVIIYAWSKPSGVPPRHFLRLVGTAEKNLWTCDISFQCLWVSVR